MRHCDPEALSLLALGEDADLDRDHLRSCAECTAEYEALRALVVAVRSPRSEVREVPPPPRVWEGIAAATGVTVAPRTARPDAAPAAAARQQPPPPAPPDGAGGAARRGWSTRVLVAAAAAGVLAGGGLAAAVTAALTEDEAAPVAASPLRSADLEPLVDSAGTGRAELVDDGGRLVLRLTAADLPDDADGFYEVWLLDEQAQGMVPLGVLSGTEGDFAVPAGLDPGDYPVVDVSVEPLDGDPTHSGDSLLRGTLDG